MALDNVHQPKVKGLKLIYHPLSLPPTPLSLQCWVSGIVRVVPGGSCAAWWSVPWAPSCSVGMSTRRPSSWPYCPSGELLTCWYQILLSLTRWLKLGHIHWGTLVQNVLQLKTGLSYWTSLVVPPCLSKCYFVWCLMNTTLWHSWLRLYCTAPLPVIMGFVLFLAAYWQLRAERMLGSSWCWPPQGITLCFHFSSLQQVRASATSHHWSHLGSLWEGILLFAIRNFILFDEDLNVCFSIFVVTELPIKVLLMLLFTLYSFTSLKKLFRWVNFHVRVDFGWYWYVHLERIQTPIVFFPHFVTLKPYFKMD